MYRSIYINIPYMAILPRFPSDKAPVALCVEAIPSTVALLKEPRWIEGN